MRTREKLAKVKQIEKEVCALEFTIACLEEFKKGLTERANEISQEAKKKTEKKVKVAKKTTVAKNAKVEKKAKKSECAKNTQTAKKRKGNK